MTFWVNKLLSIGIPFLTIIASVLFFESIESAWSFLLLIALILGYSHFIIGGVYQVRTYQRKGQRKAFIYFLGAFSLSVFVGVFFWLTLSVAYFLLFTIMLFIIHGALNDIEFVQKYTKYTFDSVYFVVLYVGVAFGFLFSSLTHRSVFSIPDSGGFMNFFVVTQTEAARIFDITVIPLSLYPKLFVLANVLIVLGLMLYSVQRQKIIVGLVYSVIIVVGNFIIFTFTDVPYVYVLFFVLTYHIYSWLFLYLEKLYKEDKELLVDFILWHFVTIVPLVVLIFWLHVDSQPVLQSAFLFFFNMNTYLTVTLAHMATSLLNETWVKDKLGL